MAAEQGPEPRPRAGLAELARRYGLARAREKQLRALLEELAGDRRAPSSVREGARALEVHAADSLVALELECVRAARTLTDLGSGAGFPGAPLAVALPRCEVVLLESQSTKCAFITTMLATARVTNARAACARAEEWRDGLGGSDVVTARALAPQAVVLEWAAPLLRLGGALVDWRGRRAPGEERAAASAAQQLGLELLEVRAVSPYDGARNHHLHVFAKIACTPERFPRRAGMARKRPLARSPR